MTVKVLETVDYTLVYFFGCLLAFSFFGVENTRKNRICLVPTVLVLLAAQGIVHVGLGTPRTEELYPLIVHVPLILTLWAMEKKDFFWAAACVLTAYLCCQPRRWLASLILLVPGMGQCAFLWMEIVLTLPLLWFFLRYISPGVRRMREQPLRTQVEFGSVPLVFYVYYYITAVYTDWLYSGLVSAVEFMPALCCIVYLFFAAHFSLLEQQRQAAEADRRTLDFQVSQSMRELENLRRAQRETAALRHDMRHHLQYLSACIEQGESARAQNYIQSVCAEIKAQKVLPLCENEPVNLILSAFAARAAAAGVKAEFQVVLPAQLALPTKDLCVILSNALENAIHAAAMANPPEVRLEGYEKQNRLYFQITNTCAAAPQFREGKPVSGQAGHGQGTKSICMLLEHYHALYAYTMEEGRFVFRFSL